MKSRLRRIEPMEQQPALASEAALLSSYVNAYNRIAAPDRVVRSNLGSNHITITRVPTFTRL